MSKGAKIVGTTLTCVGLVISGCTCEEPPPDAPQARVIVSSSGGNILSADGTANLTITVRATNDAGQADNSPVDVTASGGRFEAIDDVGTVGPDGLTFSATPENGATSVRFFCTPQTPEQITITANNGTATGSFTVTCIEPPGTIVLDLDAGDCADLTASTDDSCLLFANLNLQGLDGSVTPQVGVNLAFLVEDAVPQQAEGASDKAVLVQTTPDGSGGFNPASTVGQEQVTAVTGADGQVVVAVLGKDFDLVQTLTIRVSGVAANGTQVDQTVTVAADPFENETDLNVPAEISIATGETATITVSAIDHQGNPDTAGFVVASVDPDSGATLTGVEVDADGELVLDGAGATTAATGARVGVLLDPGSFDITAPDVTELTNVVVTIRYQPVESVPEFVATTVVRVFPEGALILNAVANPQEIRSDDNDISNVSISVERLQGGQLQPVNAADVTFSITASDVERIGFGTRAGDEAAPGELDVTVSATTDANGEASAQVSTANNRVRGDATLEVEVTDNASGETAQATVTLNIDRDPRLQSIVFVGADPSVIGVRGGAFPSTSELTFRVFDDENEPLQGASMTFDVNETADPEASVFAAVATTDAAGEARAILAAGTQAGPISIVARASFNGQTLIVESLPVVVTGGLPAFANSYIECDRLQSAQEEPFTAECVAVLVDRFTNSAPAGLGVSFRAEGGSITPTQQTGATGTATATFVSNTNLASVASLFGANGESWSYAAVVPVGALQNDVSTGATFTAADRDACYDGNPTTRCEVLAMCQEAGNDLFCPLPPDPTFPNDGCHEHLNAFALTGDVKDANPELLNALGALRGTDAAEALTFLTNTFDPADINLFNFFQDDDPNNPASVHEHVRVIVDTYLANFNRCGFPTSCFAGQQDGLGFLEFDSCAVNAGCMDFVTSTHCPQDSLRTVMAVVRGEEAFNDSNGNGVFDFVDANGNGEHDPGEVALESFIDMPEPFLDKNNNCSFDDLDGVPRLQTSGQIRHSDLFIDEDSSGDFGYINPADPTGPRLEGNGQYDRDKQTFVQTHLLSVAGGVGLFGEICLDPGGTHNCSVGAAGTVACIGTDDGVGLAPGCMTGLGTLTSSQSFTFGYRWQDGNGSCATIGFDSTSTVTADGPVIAAGDLEVDLDEAYCRIGGAPVADAPWCLARGGLSASTLLVTVTPNCEDSVDVETVQVTIDNSDFDETSFSYQIDCAL